jgi:hypothetical protein
LLSPFVTSSCTYPSYFFVSVHRVQGEVGRSLQLVEDLPGSDEWFLKQQLQRVPDSGGSSGGLQPVPF